MHTSSKIKNELSELEILGCNECSDIQYLPENKRKEIERQVAEDYYRGEMVSWSNFNFSKQVLERDIHPELSPIVVAALEGLIDDKDDPIKRVTIYHQPGSGGSTTARQILWNSRMMYRCCVVKNITKQTSEQICRLRNYEENHEDAKPVLTLVDTFDEKLVKQLYDDLESESHKYSCDVFCVLLICMRVSELPLEKPNNYVMLQQNLSNNEHDWFKKNIRIY
ncbi:SAMD9 [Mytilus edulis]|uniref:SAMD9 n=1 Tax=Mytilus edulis TaxID=6550 RepID=A0A8S3TAM8_MYTED|nr:SAMD9 [Mytilus edulis]